MNELVNTPADKNYKPSGISRAEELASQAAYAWQSDKDGNLTLEMFPDAFYRGFLKGYEQAEEDLTPLIEAAAIVYEAWNGGTMDDVRKAMAELGKRIKEAKK